MIRIDVKSLAAGVHEYDWDLSSEQLELDPDIFSNLKLHVRLDNHPSRIFVSLHARAMARLICDRTLVEFDQPVEGEYSVLFSAPDFFEGIEEEEENIRLLMPDDEEIDLTDVVRDTFLLALPHRRIAPGAEDKEIQLQFGVPDNGEIQIDPRWEALRSFSSQSDAAAEE